MRPVDPGARIKSAEFVWSLQRRFGLHLSQPAALFEQLRVDTGVVYDPLGDIITGEKATDKSLPHDAALRVLHSATQASATHTVVLGDKENPETTAIYNDGCVVDLAEGLTGHGGHDLCLEFKAWNDLVSRGSAAETTNGGQTHAFGNTEERAIHMNLGVKGQGVEGEACVWDPTSGTGRVKPHRGAYHDAIHVKRNQLVLFLVSLFGGLAPGAVAHMYTLKARAAAQDTTPYTRLGERDYLQYWTQRLSAAIVTADARRCLRRLKSLQALANRAAAKRAAARHAARALAALAAERS